MDERYWTPKVQAAVIAESERHRDPHLYRVDDHSLRLVDVTTEADGSAWLTVAFTMLGYGGCGRATDEVPEQLRLHVRWSEQGVDIL
jgi:hypothetical protein